MDAVSIHDGSPFLGYAVIRLCLACLYQQLIRQLAGFGQRNRISGAKIGFAVSGFPNNQTQTCCLIDGCFGTRPRSLIHIGKGCRINRKRLTCQHCRQSQGYSMFCLFHREYPPFLFINSKIITNFFLL